MRIPRSSDYAVLALKNGLGVSHVVASQPHGAGYDAALWQVGTTRIQANCAFSHLPGFDWQTECRLLGGPVSVFDVMTRRGCFSAEVSVSTSGEPIALEKAADESILVFVAEGAIQIEGCSATLAMNDAMIADGSGLERCTVHGRSARVVIVRLNQAAGQ